VSDEELVTRERENNNRTVTHMGPNDGDDEQESSVTSLNLISSFISIFYKIL